MSGFEREGRARLDALLTPLGRGWIHAALFDLGIYPGAIPATDSRVWGEVHRMADPNAVLSTLDDVEGFTPAEPDRSLYRREETVVTLDDGRKHQRGPISTTRRSAARSVSNRATICSI